jgi:hypothetical protein
MNRFKAFLKLILIMGTVMTISACSKTVQWEEEVPLNTGETIWVKRTVEYKLKGASGNPFDMAYRPDWTEEIAFEWKGKKYSYVGDAALIVLAISPQKLPELFARASDNSWETTHKHPCSVPSYVQLIPDDTGRKWSWPPVIDKWAYELPANLLLERKNPAEMMQRYSTGERKIEDAGLSESLTKISPSFIFNDFCKFYKS